MKMNKLYMQDIYKSSAIFRNFLKLAKEAQKEQIFDSIKSKQKGRSYAPASKVTFRPPVLDLEARHYET